jgi:hypothetical protein
MTRRFTLLCAGLSAALSSAAASAAPTVAADYDELADEQCAAQRAYPIREAWKTELRARLPEFRATWEAEGPRMVSAASALTGKPFGEETLRVRLGLCDLPSQSFGTPSVNMRYALRSFTDSPVPMRFKVDTAFHELLHGFVARHTPRASRLLAKHPGENTCVRNHLHLLALQKAVLLQLRATSELEQVIAIDSQLPSACYKRAWAIVNDADDAYKAYVAELGEGP